MRVPYRQINEKVKKGLMQKLRIENFFNVDTPLIFKSVALRNFLMIPKH